MPEGAVAVGQGQDAAGVIKLAILAVGGQGGGVLTNWIREMAETAGWHAQATAVAGVAQRTGATIYYIEMAPDHGRAPVFALAQALFDGLGVPAAPRLGSIVASFATATEAGHHAVLVFEAAEAGSRLASRVIREGGEALAGLVRNLVERGSKADTAVAGGSVIVAQPLLWQAFSEAVLALPGAAVVPRLFTGKPVEGACQLAAALLTPARLATAGAPDATRP